MHSLISTLLNDDLFLVEEKYFVSPSLVKNVLVYALLVVDFEGYWVRHVERVVAPKTPLLRVCPKRDDAQLFCIPRQVGFGLVQLAIAVLNKTVRVVNALHIILHGASFICLNLVEVFLASLLL